jgi:hypothetical protein
VERLVLDEVIQVEGPQGFLTGPAALALLRGSVEEGASHLAALSYDALRYGQALALTDAPRLGMKLYTYHSLPATPRWTRLLGSPQHARTFLGLGAGGRHLGITRRLWRELEASPGWIHLQERTRSDARRADTYKLYLSPLPEDLAALLGEIAQVLATGGATQFKVGSSMAGLLRPDKLVAYFPDKETLLRTAEVLKGRLSGAGAQGVPFTAQIDDRGLISWGSDPPARIAAGRDSWRTWVVYRLAMAMVTATKQGSNPVAPWRFALARIALDGVDTRTFAPTGEWAEADAA